MKVVPPLLLLAGCQVIARVETRKVDPLVPGCTLPTEGAGHVRLANLVPTDAHVDFCIRVSGGSYARPVLRGGGTDCPNGYAYSEVSAPFAAPVGQIDVKAIPAGQTCSALALSEATGVTVGADLGVTVVRVGPANGPEQVVAFSDTTPATAGQAKLRFVHAIGGLGPLFIGTATTPNLPTDVSARFVSDAVPFGAELSTKAHATVGTIDANAYLVIPPTQLAIGVALDTTTKALIVANPDRTPTVRTLFAIGDPASALYPVRGLLCQDDAVDVATGRSTTCTLTALSELTIETFNVGLYGANAPDEDARRPVIFSEIAKRTSDVQCLLEVSRQSDRDGVINAAKTAFPYSATLTSDLNTQPTDPTDANGNTPALPTTPPCDVAASGTDVDAALKCVTDNCTDPMTNQLKSSNSDCISSKCLSKILPLYNNAPRCFDCMIVKMTSYKPMPAIKSECETDPREPYNFDGQNPSMVLSRYPLAKTDVFVLPSWLFRRSIIYTQLQLEQGTTVDFFCAQLTSTGISGLVPYVGHYGDMNTGYQTEQLLQVSKLLAWVKKKSGGRPAIITGDWHASTAQLDPPLDELEPMIYELLSGAYTDALPAKAKHSCTECPTSLDKFNGQGSYDWLVTFLSNFPPDATTDASVYFDKLLLPLSDGTMGPISPTFGWSVKVVRPQ